MKAVVKATTRKEISEREQRNAQLARRAAAEGFVLLKNEGVLPLESKKVALFGPGASMTVAGGGGSGAMHQRYSVSIFEGLKNAGCEITTEEWIARYEKYYRDCYDAWRRSVEDKVAGISNPSQIIAIAAENRFPYPNGIPVTDSDLNDAGTAIYVLIRQAGEGADRKNEKGDFLLDDLEIANLKKISEHYNKTLLVVNVGGLIDLTPIDEMNIGGILFYAQGGMEGGNAFSDVVTGKISPSGKLACTWAMNYSDYPCANSYSSYGNPREQEYREGIYVGYRYFDSFGVKPRYEFGYGLSYTQFEINTSNEREEDGKIIFRVTVSNRGMYAGKEVVQAYITVPRRACNAEYQRLVAFRKTKELRPNESETFEMSFDLKECACYYPAVRKGGKGAYWLNKGKYILRIGISSRKTKVAAVFCLPKEVKTEVCDGICPVQEKINEISCGIPENAIPVGVKTLPINPKHIRTVTHEYPILPVYKSDKIKNIIEVLSVEELATLVVGAGLHGKNYVTVLGASGYTTSELYESHGIPNVVLCDGPAGLNIMPEIVETEDDVKSTQMMPQYDFGAFGKMLRTRLGKPEDGTMHYQYATAWPVGMLLAQTWNPDLAEEIGNAVGTEMEEFGVTVWLAPGMNLYRNPLCGRTFEYYSEDPVVAGKIAAGITRGVQSHEGRGVCAKHFACNNVEKDRDLSSSNVNERALRELYLKAFRIVVEESQPRTVMASYNKVNGVYSTNNYDLLVKVLRQEWGFQGMVTSDWNAVDIDRGDPVVAMQAQCDILMPGKSAWKEMLVEAVNSGRLSVEDLKRCAARVLKLISENKVAELKFN